MLCGLVLFLVSCASSPTPRDSSAAGAAAADRSEYYEGSGRGAGLAEAMNAAKMDAVRNAVIDMIGAEAERANSRVLQDVLYSTRNPNQYVYNETMERTRRENLGTVESMDMIFEIVIRVNTQAVEQVLNRHGITGSAAGAGTATGEGRAQGLVEDEQAPHGESPATVGAGAADALALESSDFASASDEEQRFIRRYVDTMTYMVYFPEDSDEDPFIMRSAVAQANRYLTSNGFFAVDAAQIESLRRDQQFVYEAETGREMSMIQWIAQRLNADMYIEVDALTSSESQGGNHYATANVTLRMFETSTGQLLGTVNRRSPRTLSRSSADDATLNAVQSTVFQAMPDVVDQSRIQMAGYLSRGVRYDLILTNTSDPRLVSEFRRRLGARVADIVTVSQTAEQTQWAVYYFGRSDDLQDLIYDVSDIVAGLDGMYLVMTRGKSLTFDTGL
ncbi:MAG: hypothetical protein EA428_12305 [Spirochaetaceae bacterium]|nr:MAG: hypothetical protein EA428_12305 [Spirochaetaceae bacterium]